MNYIPYHLHTHYSLLDSCTKPEEYMELVLQNEMRAISFSEHGKPLNWTEKWNLCKENNVKYLHSVEIYLTESLENKVRDNYHTVLIARNMDGLRELNSLVTMSCNKDHFYYTNRLSFDEFLNVSDNIISTSACLASPLNKLSQDNPYYEKLVEKYTFLEIQPHNNEDQIGFNQHLYELSKMFGKKLIAATDTHSSTEYKAECREVLLKAKHKSYGDEDKFDLTFKNYDQLVSSFEEQDALPRDAWYEAIENTNLLYDMTDEIDLDTSIKYPISYGSREADEIKFKETVETMFQDKLDRGIIPKEKEADYRAAILEEEAVIHQLNMEGFMLSQSEITRWCKQNGLCLGPGRGSVGGSRIAFITDITEIDAERWGTVFSRFANPDRVEIGDIDTDCIESDRAKIFNYIIERFGEDKTARVASFGTLQDKAVIEEIGRALALEFKEKFPDKPNPWELSEVVKIKKLYDADPEEARVAYKTLFYFFDGLVGTKISQSIHPAGIVISPITLADNYGVFDKDGETCFMLDMDNIHDFTGLAKYDLLILKTVEVIRDTCSFVGIDYPKMWDLNLLDEDVWADMAKDLSMIFQMESAFAADCFRKFKPKTIEEMALVTACIRPSGASYREELLKRKQHKNPSELIDELLAKNLGFLVFQEDTTKFLTDICGFSGGEADTVRRGISRKKKEILDAAMPKILEGYCSKSSKPRDVAENEAKEFLQIIEDSADYQFNYSHAVAYSMVGYMCGYFRYYYPLEFITAYLNNAANEDDIRVGTEYAKKCGIKVTMPKWGMSKGEYFFDRDTKTISKGLASIKYIGDSVATELYNLSVKNLSNKFVDILMLLDAESSIDTRQIDILTKIDYFSEFGNQRELLYIKDLFYSLFKKGQAKQIKKEKVDGTELEEVVKRYSVGVTKKGGVSANYTLLDNKSMLEEIEDMVKAKGMPDLEVTEKMKNFEAAMGYAGYVSGREEDRRKLYITGIRPLVRKKDGKQFGYSFFTRSIGSGIESRFTVFNSMYNKVPVKEKDVVYCLSWKRDGEYLQMSDYRKVM